MPSSRLAKQSQARDYQVLLEALLAEHERLLQQAFEDFIAETQDEFSEDAIVEAVEENSVVALLALLGIILQRFVNAYIESFNDSAVRIARHIEQVTDRRLVYDPTNERAVTQLRAQGARLVQSISNDVRTNLVNTLAEGIAQGRNPRESARLFRQSIGLTEYHQQVLANYRRLLEQNSARALRRDLRDRRFDPTLLRAIRTNEPLTPEQINRMVGRYRENLLRYRSTIVGRTESLRAVHQASEEIWTQAVNNGLFDASQITSRWLTAGDNRVRHSHDGMNGQEQPVGVPFVSDAGNLLRYPGDPIAPIQETAGCRCIVIRTIRG